MDLYVIRHAIAEERREGLDDAERALTDEGRERFSLGVRGLARLGVGLDLVLTSPWVRAARTAELLAPLASGPVEPSQHLAGPPGTDLIHPRRARAGIERAAVVGHEPWLSELVAWLVAGDAGLGFAFALKKGGVAHLEGEPVPGAMRLVDFWRPRTLRALAAEA